MEASFVGKHIHDLVDFCDEKKLAKTLDFINSCYLGFSIIKPLNKSLIGRSCIKHYPEDNARDRKYKAIRKYSVNLFGLPLSVKSMAFQEQDGNVAVCATISIWAAFQITSKKYQHFLPAPSEITKLALSETSYAISFPNDGLTIEQIGVAVSKMGLIPLTYRIKSHRQLKGILFSYLNSGIPIILGITLYDLDKDDNVKNETKSLHAVTANGYSFKSPYETGEPFEEALLILEEGKEISLYSSKMTRFYVHDDQLCPFAKMKFENRLYTNADFLPLSTSWHCTKNLNKQKIAKVENVIIPLEENIRVTYVDILTKISRIDGVVHRLLKEAVSDSEWKIYLSILNDFRNKILHSTSIDSNSKKTLLSKSFPKYLWIGKLIKFVKTDTDIQEIPQTYLLFDATAGKNEQLLVSHISFDLRIHNVISKLIKIRSIKI